MLNLSPTVQFFSVSEPNTRGTRHKLHQGLVLRWDMKSKTGKFFDFQTNKAGGNESRTPQNSLNPKSLGLVITNIKLTAKNLQQLQLCFSLEPETSNHTLNPTPPSRALEPLWVK